MDQITQRDQNGQCSVADLLARYGEPEASGRRQRRRAAEAEATEDGAGTVRDEPAEQRGKHATEPYRSAQLVNPERPRGDSWSESWSPERSRSAATWAGPGQPDGPAVPNGSAVNRPGAYRTSLGNGYLDGLREPQMPREVPEPSTERLPRINPSSTGTVLTSTSSPVVEPIRELRRDRPTVAPPPAQAPAQPLRPAPTQAPAGLRAVPPLAAEQTRDLSLAEPNPLFEDLRSGDLPAADGAYEDEVLDDDAQAAPGSPVREWAAVAGQVGAGVAGGAVLWLVCEWLWQSIPLLALIVALVVITGLVWVIRYVRRAEDLQTMVIAVLVGLFVTVSPAALLLVGR